METQNTENAKNANVQKPESTKTAAPVQKNESKSKSKIPLIIAGVCLVLAALIFLFVILDTETTGKIRDTMIVIYVLETIVTVTALVVLVVQVTKLVTFLKYEIEPILTTTGKTVKKFSGTVSFLCENAVEPTVNAASTISGVKNAVNGVLSIFKMK